MIGVVSAGLGLHPCICSSLNSKLKVEDFRTCKDSESKQRLRIEQMKTSVRQLCRDDVQGLCFDATRQGASCESPAKVRQMTTDPAPQDRVIFHEQIYPPVKTCGLRITTSPGVVSLVASDENGMLVAGWGQQFGRLWSDGGGDEEKGHKEQRKEEHLNDTHEEKKRRKKRKRRERRKNGNKRKRKKKRKTQTKNKTSANCSSKKLSLSPRPNIQTLLMYILGEYGNLPLTVCITSCSTSIF